MFRQQPDFHFEISKFEIMGVSCIHVFLNVFGKYIVSRNFLKKDFNVVFFLSHKPVTLDKGPLK